MHTVINTCLYTLNFVHTFQQLISVLCRRWEHSVYSYTHTYWPFSYIQKILFPPVCAEKFFKYTRMYLLKIRTYTYLVLACGTFALSLKLKRKDQFIFEKNHGQNWSKFASRRLFLTDIFPSITEKKGNGHSSKTEIFRQHCCQ